MAEYTGADLFVDALEQYGVEHVFGNPGTTELPVLDAIARSELEYVLGLHEDVAVGMASGYAQTRRYHAHDDPSVMPVGVVNLHITPGLAHGIGNTYAADFAGSPVVITAGNHELDFRHEEPLLTGELEEMVDQFCKWSDEVLHVDALPTMLRRAFRVAMTPPTGPVFLGLPVDVMMEATDRRPERLGAIPDAGRGDPDQVGEAVDLLVEAEEPTLVFGDNVARTGAVDEAVELAEATGGRVHAEILACETNFPGTHEQWVSFLPPDEATARMLMDTDVLLLAGCSTNTTLLHHEDPLVPEDTTVIQISDDAWEVGKNEPADVAVLGDPGHAMGEIAGRVAEGLDSETRSERLEEVAEVKEMVQGRMETMWEDDSDDPRASKADLVDAMREVAPDAYIVDEGITSKGALITRWPFEDNQYISNKGGGLGYGLPASIGAALAEGMTDDPRDVVGFIGDGSYLYYPHAMYTAARYGIDVTVAIPDNRSYHILKTNTLRILGGDMADYDFTDVDLDPAVDIVQSARGQGSSAYLVDDRDALDETLRTALDEDGPSVVDVLVQE